MAPRSTVSVDGRKPCTKCGETKLVTDFYTTGVKRDGTPKYNSWCKGCAKAKAASYHQTTWGTGGLQRSAFLRTKNERAYLSYLLAKAKRRHACSVSLEDLEELWKRQGGVCALTGWKMTFVLGSGVVATNASLDRVDSALAYTPDNVQLVCRAANVAKHNLPEAQFLALCEAVYTQHYGKDTSLAA